MTFDAAPWDSPLVDQSPHSHTYVEPDVATETAIIAIEQPTINGLNLPALLDTLAARPALLQNTVIEMRHMAVESVQARAVERYEKRLERLDGEPPQSPTDIRKEVVGLADDGDVLEALAGALLAGKDQAKLIAADLVQELPGANGKPRRSVKVADGHGFELSVTATPRTDLKTDLGEIVDVLAAHLYGVGAEAPGREVSDMKSYAAGVRGGMAALLDVLASPKFKSTALESLVTKLQSRDEDELASRLKKAFGRVEVGEPSVKMERKPMPEEKTP